MTEAEQQSFMARVGTLVLEAAVGRLLLELSEAEVFALQTHLQTEAGTEDVVAHLLQNYPQFKVCLEAELAGFQADAEQVLG